MTITVNDLGTMPNGEVVKQVVIENANGHKLGLVSWGASWQFLQTKAGDELVLAYKDAQGYWDHAYFLGNAIGRVAGRIDGASFELNGKTVNLKANEGKNALHGGEDNFATRNWDFTVDEAAGSVTFTTTMTEADDNFPGTMPTSLTYTFTDDDEVRLDFSAESDEDTLYNPTSHAYFNPAGIDTDARELTLQLKSPRHLEFREDQIPTGKLLETAGTPFDFQTPAKIGDKIAEMNGAYDAKFDDAFELVYEAGTPSAIVTDEKSGRSIEMTTDRNAVIFFITNPAVADHEGDLDWFEANPYNAVALEAQTLSDAIHHPEFGDIVLPAGEKRSYTTTYAFKNL